MGFGECANRAFPQSADHRSALVPAQDPFNDWPLISLDKADNLHLTATLATFSRINFVDALDQHSPCGEGTGTWAVTCGPLCVGSKNGPLLMATWAEAALPAGEGDEHLMVAILAADNDDLLDSLNPL